MKKISILLLAVSVLLPLNSCHKDTVQEKEKTYLDYVLMDYKAITDKYPEAKDRFVEARFTLDGIISDVPTESLKVKTLITICYAWLKGHSEIYVCERDFETGKAELYDYSADSPWLGDMQVDGAKLESLGLSLEDAIAAAKKEAGAGDGISTASVTLRKPIYPFWENPQYVFGGVAGRHDHVFVDASTGKVSIEEMPVPEGGSSSFIVDDYNKIIDIYNIDSPMGYPVDIQGRLVQIIYELNEPMNASQASELEPVKVTYVFNLPAADGAPDYLIYGIRNSFKLGTPLEYSEEPLKEPWSEGRYIGPEYIDGFIPLEDAIYEVKLGNVTDPDTNIAIICFPERFEQPMYRFVGKNTKDVYIDATTGELAPDQ